MAAPISGSYSFLNVSAAISGPGGSFSISAAGVSDGGIRIAMEGDKDRMTIGAGGAGMHSLIASNAGRITVSLLKTAPGNAQMNQLYRHQKSSAAYWGQNVITINNPVTGDAITCTDCSFVKQPDVVYTPEGGMMEWAFNSVDIDEVLGNTFQNTGIL
jgi:Protein of unknown function (DUF3277)